MKSEPAQNQTVEEILASIRQAISEDETKRGIARPRTEAAPTRPENVSSLFAPATGSGDQTGSGSPPAQDVIDLAIEKAIDGVRAELTGEPDEPEAAGDPAAERPGPLAQPARGEPRAQPVARREETRRERPLMSPRAGAAVSASFDNLARSMAAGGGRKLDELVEAMLRPMLRSWLDDNLPVLVERLVREEIDRVSRGRR